MTMDVALDSPPLRSRFQVLRVRWGVDFVASIYFACAVYLWIIGLKHIDISAMSDYGLASVLPVYHWAALLFLSVGFTLSLSSRISCKPAAWLHLFALIAVLHLTPAIVYDAARYSWTWKHIGVIDFIQRFGRVEESIRFLTAYHNWPGFFFVSAWIASYFQAVPLDIARAVRFVPAISTAFYLLALIPIYRSLNRDIRQLLLASWIFIAGNWVGQDYFSPQGMVYLFYLFLLGLALTTLSSPSIWNKYRPVRWRLAEHVLNLVAKDQNPTRSAPGRFLRFAATIAAFALILAITASHQLTPITVILALIALVAIGRLSPIFCLFAILAELTWLLYVATPFVASHLAEELNVFGQGLVEAAGRLADTSSVTEGMYWVVVVGRATTLLIGGLAIAGCLRRVTNGFVDVRAAVLAAAPLPLFVNSYGGEILFRVYFFALPFLAFFAASAFFPTASKGNSAVNRMLVSIVAMFLTVGFVFANNGKDQQYTFRPDEIEAAYWLYKNAPAGTLLIEGSRSYPSQFLNYENFIYLPISNETREERQKIIDDPVGKIAAWLSDPSLNSGYVIITRSQKADVYSEGIMPFGSLDEIERKLLASPRMMLVYSTLDAKIFKLNPALRQLVQ